MVKISYILNIKYTVGCDWLFIFHGLHTVMTICVHLSFFKLGLGPLDTKPVGRPNGLFFVEFPVSQPEEWCRM